MGFPRRDKVTGLSPREQRFCEEYVKDLNVSAAYRRAGFTGRSNKYAFAVLQRPQVRRELARLQASIQEHATVDAARVLDELASVALADPRRLFDAHGHLKAVTDWRREDAACVAAVDVLRRPSAGEGAPDQVLKVRMWDKPKALELLAKHFGMLTDKVEVRGDADLVARLASARQRQPSPPASSRRPTS